MGGSKKPLAFFPGPKRSPKDFQKSIPDAAHVTEQGSKSTAPETARSYLTSQSQGLEKELSPE